MKNTNKSLYIDAFFTGFSARYDSKFIFAGERHNFWEILYVAKGSMVVFSGDKTYELSGGNLIFFPPMQFHSFKASKNTSPEIASISFSLGGGGYESLKEGYFEVSPKEEEIIFRAISAYEEGVKYAFPIKNQIALLKIEELILTLLENQMPKAEETIKIGTDNYRNILKVMEENICNKLSMEDISKICKLSLSNLKKTFFKYSGVSIMKYYNNLRLEKSIELMSQGKNMAEISEILNFSSQHYFTTAFKRQYGVSPLAYKKELIKRKNK